MIWIGIYRFYSVKINNIISCESYLWFILTCVIGVSPDQHDRDSVDTLQQTGNLIYSSHSQLSSTDVDREKHDEIVSTTEEGRVEQEVMEKGERLQPKAYHIDERPVGPLKGSYMSLTGQSPQNIPVGHGIAENSSVYKKKRERDTMHISHGNETEKVAFAFYSFRQRG